MQCAYQQSDKWIINLDNIVIMLADSQIKWLPLKLNMIPLIDKQIKYIYDQYLQTRAFILSGDILALRIFNQITQKATQRIKQIDAFYVKYAMDPRIRYIYSSKALLVKIVDNRDQFENINGVQNEDREINTFQQTKNSLFANQHERTQIKVQKPSKISKNFNNTQPSNHYTFNHNQKDEQIQVKITQTAKDNNVLRLSDLKNKSAKSKSPIKIFEGKESSKILKKGSSRKIQPFIKKTTANRKIEQVQLLQKQKLATKSRLQQDPQQIKQSFKDLSELIFTIKMTKQEYNEFIRLKRQNNHA